VSGNPKSIEPPKGEPQSEGPTVPEGLEDPAPLPPIPGAT
jgi:hypothetical protein